MPTQQSYLNLGCGAFSPDGTRIVLGGSTGSDTTALYHPEVNGIYTVRASDGGDLVRLTHRAGTHPNYSPDGTQVVFKGSRDRAVRAVASTRRVRARRAHRAPFRKATLMVLSSW